MEVILSGGPLGGEVFVWDPEQEIMTFEGCMYRNDGMQAVFIGMA